MKTDIDSSSKSKIGALRAIVLLTVLHQDNTYLLLKVCMDEHSSQQVTGPFLVPEYEAINLVTRYISIIRICLHMKFQG